MLLLLIIIRNTFVSDVSHTTSQLADWMPSKLHGGKN